MTFIISDFCVIHFPHRVLRNATFPQLTFPSFLECFHISYFPGFYAQIMCSFYFTCLRRDMKFTACSASCFSSRIMINFFPSCRLVSSIAPWFRCYKRLCHIGSLCLFTVLYITVHTRMCNNLPTPDTYVFITQISNLLWRTVLF